MSPSAFSADDDLTVAPAVFGPEHFPDNEDDDPATELDRHASVESAGATDRQPTAGDAVLFVPTTASAHGEVQLALKPLEDGRVALLVYTSLEQLVSGCGEQQPWAAVSETQLEELFHSSGADVVAVDAGLTAEQRWNDQEKPHTLEQFRAGGAVSHG